MTITRITRTEAWLAGGTHLAREKSAHTRGQAVSIPLWQLISPADSPSMIRFLDCRGICTSFLPSHFSFSSASD